MENVRSGDEDLGTRLSRKCKANPVGDINATVPVPRSIRSRLRSASNQKSQPASQDASEVPPTNTNGSLSKHLKTLRPSSSLVSGPFLVSSKAPIVILAAPASSQSKGKSLEVSVAPADPVVEASHVQAISQSRFKLPKCFQARSPIAPLFAEGLPTVYIPRWKTTPSTVVDTPEGARNFMAHALPPSHRFMNFALDPEMFDDQYSLSIYEGFFGSAGKLQRVNALRDESEGLLSNLKTFRTVAAELRCMVVDAEKKLLERENVGARLEQRERAWEPERGTWLAEKERLLADVKHYKEAASVSVMDVDILYADLGIAQEDIQKLVVERQWLLSQGFGPFLFAFSQSEEFKGRVERIYRAYRDLGYQAGLKDGYSYSSQGLKRKKTPYYNSKAKKHLAKLDEEFSCKTPALIAKITDNPLMSLDELKSLLESAGPSSSKSPYGDNSP
ncbi:hypothetical protein Hanom_Chr06g00549261 [Helianthus anomalus]